MHIGVSTLAHQCLCARQKCRRMLQLNSHASCSSLRLITKVMHFGTSTSTSRRVAVSGCHVGASES